MLSARNIHFAILGVILGASTAYVYAFYRVQSHAVPPALTAADAQGEVPPGHPDVNNEQMLAAMKKAVDADPTQPDILNRYALALFQAEHYEEAEQWFGKALQLAPDNTDIRSMHGAVLWRLGNKDAAESELEATLKRDRGHIPSLHGLVLLSIEKHNVGRAEELIKRIENVEPTYNQLPELRSRLKAERGGN